jgi:hypothetical protein
VRAPDLKGRGGGAIDNMILELLLNLVGGVGPLDAIAEH